MTTRLANLAVNEASDAVCTLLDAGTLDIYDGKQPSGPDEVVTGQTLLTVLAFSIPAFGPATAGKAAANSIADGTAVAAGTASWFRACRADGTAVFDGSIGLADADLQLDSVELELGAVVRIEAFTFTIPKK